MPPRPLAATAMLPLTRKARPPNIFCSASAGSSASSGPDHLIGRPIDEVERYYMEKALELTHGNREEAAKLLGIGERTLYRKLQEWKKETAAES